MLIAKIENNAVVQMADYREMFPQTSFPVSGPPDEFMQSNSCLHVTMFKPHDRTTEKMIAVAPYIEGGQVFTVAIEPLTQAEIDQTIASKIADKQSQLWAATDRYVTGYISGLAIGLLTIGTMQQKPKSLAITAWSQSVWNEYYVRKAAVTFDSVLDLDFSSFGPMPYSVPELQAEVFEQ
jgi:hypothetical protein